MIDEIMLKVQEKVPGDDKRLENVFGIFNNEWENMLKDETK